jgi:hypothetical protein
LFDQQVHQAGKAPGRFEISPGEGLMNFPAQVFDPGEESN